MRVLTLALAALVLAVPPALARMADDEVRRLIINESLQRWNAECPCPYSSAWNGQQCGNNSAYIKRIPGAPYCYPQDVPPGVIYQYRRDRAL
jgi:hypothetical protein